jgi:hypothetical protein
LSEKATGYYQEDPVQKKWVTTETPTDISMLIDFDIDREGHYLGMPNDDGIAVGLYDHLKIK